MKLCKRLLGLLCLLLPCWVNAQAVHWHCHHADWLFLGVPNYLTLEVEGVPYSELSLHTNDGQRLSISEQGTYQLRTTRRRITLSLYWHQQQDSTLLDQRQFAVKALPKPTASIGRYQHQDTILKKVLLIQHGIAAPLVNYSINTTFRIESFTLIVTRGDQLVYLKDIKGAVFDKALKRDLATRLHGGERLFFTNIKFRSNMHYNKFANSIELYLAKPSAK